MNTTRTTGNDSGFWRHMFREAIVLLGRGNWLASMSAVHSFRIKEFKRTKSSDSRGVRDMTHLYDCSTTFNASYQMQFSSILVFITSGILRVNSSIKALVNGQQRGLYFSCTTWLLLKVLNWESYNLGFFLRLINSRNQKQRYEPLSKPIFLVWLLWHLSRKYFQAVLMSHQ